MIGKYEIIVKNRRVQYKFIIKRNITILKGDSATGKTTLIEMIQAYQQNKENSGVFIKCQKECVVLNSQNWEIILKNIHDSIVFIDEGDYFVKSKDFAKIIKSSNNYYVIVTRSSLFNLPYSVEEIYGIKNTNGNKYQETKRIYSKFYPIYDNTKNIIKPDLVIVEDSNSGYDFFSYVCKSFNITCVSAKGKANICNVIKKSKEQNILVIADGAAFGSEIERILSLRKIKNMGFYFPESFEWLILKSKIINNNEIDKILEEPYNYIESKKYFSWEQFFTDLLIDETKGTYYQYNKDKLSKYYLNERNQKKIISNIPKEMIFNK